LGFSVINEEEAEDEAEDEEEDNKPSPLMLPENDFLCSDREPLRIGILPPEVEERADRPTCDDTDGAKAASMSRSGASGGPPVVYP
jgi:hypothetical protein